MATALRSRRMVEFNPNFINPRSKSPNFTIPDSRRRTPVKGILKKNDRAVVVAQPPASKKLVIGQVKILKRGELLKDSSIVLKDANSADGEGSKVAMSGRRNLPAKKQKKTEKNKKKIVPSMEAGLENVSEQTKKMAEYFAGFIFFDSPPPSSVPLPGFLTR